MAQHQQVYTVLSRIMDSGNLKGFLLVSDIGHVQPVTIEQVQAVGAAVQYTNAVYDKDFKTLNGTQGSLTSYPSINTNYALISKGGVIVLNVILEKGTKEPIGVVAFDALGARYNISFRKLDELLKTNSACNFKFVNQGSVVTVVQNNGQPFPVVEMQTKEKSAVYHSGKKEQKPVVVKSKSLGDLPEIFVYSLDAIKTSEFGQSAQVKLTEAGTNMKYLTPYYYTIYQTISKKPVLGYGTFGVTEDTMYYDIQFVASLSIAQLTFVLIHEMLHIAMQHSLRFGKRSNHELWNIATDLYINTVICHDFGVKFGESEKKIDTIMTNSQGVKVKKDTVIQTPMFGVFLETIGETLDLAKEMPETIYDKLLKENPQYGQPKGGQGQSQQGNSGQKSQSGQGQGQQPQQQQNQQNQGQGQGQQGQNQQGQGQGQGQGQQNQQQGQNDSNNQDGSPFDKSAMNQNPQQTTSDLQNGGEGQEYDGGFQEVTVIYNGKKLTGKIIKDVMTNNSSKSEDAKQANIDASKSALQRMATKIKMEEEETGESLVKNAGAGGGLCQRYIEFGLSSAIRWQDIVRNLCKKSPKKIFTLANPNVDYMNMGMTVAARRAIGKPTRLSGLKFCIDISGSVTKQEANFYLSEVNNLLTHYDVEGELIYWSTMVGDAGNFSTLRDMLKVKPVSDGGTSVRCVFDYLSGKTRVNNKREPDKMRDIEAIFIITDGCFSNDYGDYKDMFGRKTYWLVTGNPITFNPPFGRVIGFKME